MHEIPPRNRSVPSTLPLLGEMQGDHRQRAAILQAEALERRRRELGEQREPSKSAADRIRIWERLHQLLLPPSPGHRLITIIATDTGLSLDEVRNEQRVRAAAKVAPAG